MNHLNIFYKLSDQEIYHLGELELIAGTIYFQYTNEFLNKGWNISPLKLRFEKIAQAVSNQRQNFGLPGLCYDSLPDGWGLLLIKRHLASKGMSFFELNGIDLLHYVGERGMGALTFAPSEKLTESVKLTLGQIASEAQVVLEGETSQVLSQLMIAGGSPGGARPKALIVYDEQKNHAIVGKEELPAGYRHWLVKFSGKGDRQEESIVEQVLMIAAKRAGIRSEPSCLIDDSDGSQWFATRRFDRGPMGERFHVHSVAGLLDMDFHVPSLDYEHVFALTHRLTVGNKHELKQIFKLMVYNVLIGNRDDHAKNFSFIFKNGQWQFSPAYDLTYNQGQNGHHFTSILGKSKDITTADLIQLGSKYFARKELECMLHEVREVAKYILEEIKGLGVKTDLQSYLQHNGF